MDEANLRDLSDAQLESLVLTDHAKPGDKGAAKAELVRRQRKHELELDQKKREHDVALFNAHSDLTRLSHEFEERLAGEQQAHAEALVSEQASPARNAANASMWAAAAATLSAMAAILSAGVAYWTYTNARPPPPAIGANAPQAAKESDAALEARRQVPMVQFYTQAGTSASVAGIQIQNQGAEPLTVSQIAYFVDGLPMRGADEATARARLLHPEKIQTLDFAAGDTLAAGEKDWLYFRSARDRGELPKFLDFIASHAAIGVTVCTEEGRCVSRCSGPGKCGPGFGGG
jgi:hypothetical protein